MKLKGGVIFGNIYLGYDYIELICLMISGDVLGWNWCNTFERVISFVVGFYSVLESELYYEIFGDL